MSSVSEPTKRPIAAVSRAASGVLGNDIRKGGAPAAPLKKSKSTRASARKLVKAAYDPLRRAVSGAGRSKQDGAQGESGRKPNSARDTAATGEGANAPAAPARLMGQDEAAAFSQAASAPEGLALVAQTQTERLRAAEGIMRESMQKYQAAMRQMEVRFEVLDRDLSLKKNRNPIHHIESRIKKPASIYEKLRRRELPATVESMEQNILDIAGVRVICSYIHDVYGLLDLLKKQDDLQIVTVKDYIANPKPNGYRSLHVIVRIPVYFMDRKELVPVEVQLRTIAMDFWASLEHSLKYKAIHEVEGIDASDELKDCSRIIEDVEARMLILARALEAED